MSESASTGKHVFISYVHEDAARVDQLQQILERSLRTWRDTADLWPGQDWRTQIRRAIADDALVFSACFSLASGSKETSYQNEELTQAIEQLRLRPADSSWLIPVRFDDCQIPDRDIGGGRTLRSIHYVSLFGDNYSQEADRLVASIRRVLNRPPGQATESAPWDGSSPADRPERDFADLAPAIPARLTQRILALTDRLQTGTLLAVEATAERELSQATVTMTGISGPPGAATIPPPARLFWHPGRQASTIIAQGASTFINVVRTGPIPPGALIDSPDQDLPWSLQNGQWRIKLQLTATGYAARFLTAAFTVSPSNGIPCQRLEWTALTTEQQNRPANNSWPNFTRIILRGGPLDGQVGQHDRHPADYLAFAGNRWHTWKRLDPQAWRRDGHDDLPVYDYVGNTEP